MKSQVFMFSFAEIIIIFFVFRRRYLKQFCMSKTIQYFLTEVYFDIYIYIYTLCIMQTSGIKTRPVGLIGR